LASLLLQVARIGFVSKMYFDKAFATDKTFAWSDYCIMLQCQLANKDASQFFNAAGFTELDHVENESEVNGLTYDGFLKQRNALAKSKTDYINFIIGGTTTDLFVMKHVSDEFAMKDTKVGKQKTDDIYKSLSLHSDSKKNDSLFFPFHIKREHILILSQGLDLFYLPFQKEIFLDDYLTPSKDLYMPNSITVNKEDFNITNSPTRWYNDNIIDFLSRW